MSATLEAYEDLELASYRLQSAKRTKPRDERLIVVRMGELKRAAIRLAETRNEHGSYADGIPNSVTACHDCGAPTFQSASGVAIWCTQHVWEGGDCKFNLMGG